MLVKDRHSILQLRSVSKTKSFISFVHCARLFKYRLLKYRLSNIVSQISSIEKEVLFNDSDDDDDDEDAKQN